MSKGGVYAHFGSKEELQVATVEAAGVIFRAEVIGPALGAAPGVPQLLAFCEAYFDHLERRSFPGGCFFAGAALEMGTDRGTVQEKVASCTPGSSS
jgi:AcrR family transcriptional regulator